MVQEILAWLDTASRSALFSIFAMLWCAATLVAGWRIFLKAGKPGWYAVVPLLNTYQRFDIAWEGMFGVGVIVLTVIAVYLSGLDISPRWVDFAATAAALLEVQGLYKLSRSFGHGFWFFVGLVFAHPVFLLILAFGESRYHGPRSAIKR